MASRIALVFVLLLGALPAAAQPAARRTPPPASQPRYTPEEQEACLPDAERLCDIAQQSSVVLACLRRQWDQVSEECRTVLERHKE
jgi:hypothetical protein